MKLHSSPEEAIEEIEKEKPRSMNVSGQYGADAHEMSLLKKSDEQLLSGQIERADDAYFTILDIATPVLLNNTDHPRVQKMIQRLQVEIPKSYREHSAEHNVKVTFGNIAMNNGHANSALLLDAMDIARQKQDLLNSLQGSQATERVEAILMLLKMANIIEAGIVDAAKELVVPKQRESIEAKEKIIATGNEARDRFCRANLRLVMQVAKRYQGLGMAYEDLVEEGNIGLIRAVDGFDASLGFKFSTYATRCIKTSITRALPSQGKDIRVPVHVYELFVGFKRRFNELQAKSDKPLTYEESMKELGYAENEQNTIKEAIRSLGALDLDHEYSDSEGTESMYAKVEDRGSVAPDEDMNREYDEMEIQGTNDVLEKILIQLVKNGDIKERDAEIARMRLGLSGRKKMNQQEIGDHFEFTRSRAQQIEVAVFCSLERGLALETMRVKAKKEQATAPVVKNNFAHLQPAFELMNDLLSQRANKYRETVPEEMADDINELIRTSSLSSEQREILEMRLGLNGREQKTFKEISTKYGNTRQYIQMLQSEAMQIMNNLVAGLHLKPTLDSVDVPQHDGSNDQLESIFLRAKGLYQIISSGQSSIVNSKEIGDIVYIDSQDGTLHLDSITTITEELEDPYDEEERKIAAIKAFLKEGVAEAHREEEEEQNSVMKELFGSFTNVNDPHAKFPSWMKQLNEATATRLHTLLMRSAVSMMDVRTFFENAGLIGNRLEQACRDCLMFENIYALKVRDWIRSLDAQPHRSGEYIKDVSFLHLAEREKVLIPNTQLLIERHLDGCKIPFEERSILMIGAAWSTPSIEKMFGNVADMSVDSLRKVMQWSDIDDSKHDVIVMNHLPNVLRFEEDERALLWAQAHLKDDGIAISIMHDRVSEPATREHLRTELDVYTRGAFLPRYSDYLRGRGFSVEVCRPSLNIESHSIEGAKAMQDVLSFMLSNRKKVEEGLLDAYIQRYVTDDSANGRGMFRETFAFLIAYANENIDISEEVRKNEEIAQESTIPERRRHEYGMQVHKRSGKRVERAKAQIDIPEQCSQATAMKRPVTENTRATDTIEFQRARGKLVNLLFGKERKRGENTEGGRGKLFRSKRDLTQRSYTPLPKATEKLISDAKQFNNRAIQQRRENPCAVGLKEGEILMHDKMCVQIDAFASVHGLDARTLGKTVKALGIERVGTALEMGSEDDALELGYRTSVYDVEMIKSIPYVRQRLDEELVSMFENFSAEQLATTQRHDRFNTFLQELDDEIDAEELRMEVPKMPSRTYALSDAPEELQRRIQVGAEARKKLFSLVQPQLQRNVTEEPMQTVFSHVLEKISMPKLCQLASQHSIHFEQAADETTQCLVVTLAIVEKRIDFLDRLATTSSEEEAKDLLLLINIADIVEDPFVHLGNEYAEHPAMKDVVAAKAKLTSLGIRAWHDALPSRLSTKKS